MSTEVFSGERVVELVESDALLDAREVHRIARRDVVARTRARPPPVDQLDLVDDDARLERISLGDHEKPVEHSRCGSGLAAANTTTT